MRASRFNSIQLSNNIINQLKSYVFDNPIMIIIHMTLVM